MTPLRYEVWERPGSAATFARKFPIRAAVNASFTTDLFGQGQIELPLNYPLLDEIIAYGDTIDLDKASIIRVYHGEDDYQDFYAQTMEKAFTDTGARVAVIQGGNIGTALERLRIRQYDYNAVPSVDPDWIYGDDGNELDNSYKDTVFLIDFEDGGDGGFVELTGVNTNPLTSGPDNTTAEAETGTHSLTFDATQRHSGVTKSITVAAGVRGQITIKFKSNTTGKRFTAFVRQVDGDTDFSTNGHLYSDYHLIELDNVAAGGGGLPPGSTDGTWQTFSIDYQPAPDQTIVNFGVQFDHHDGSDGPIAYFDQVTFAGFGLGLEPWKEWGNLATFEVDATPPAAILGTAPHILFKAGDTVANWNGVSQLVEGNTIGQTKTFTGSIYHEAGADRDFLVIIKNESGAFVNSAVVTVPTATETPFAVSGVMTEENVYVQVRKGDTTTPVDTWLVDPAFGAGLGTATIGKMLNDLFDSRSPTWDWITRTWTDLLDSDGVAWIGDESLRFRRGTTMRSVVESMQRLGYEFSFKTDPTDDTVYELNAYNPEGLGSALTEAITSRPGLASAGPFLVSEPLASYVMVEGDEQYWAEATDQNIDDVWGPIEHYQPSQDTLDVATLAREGDSILEAGRVDSMTVTLQNPILTPGIDYDVGDTLTLMFGESILPADVWRCIAISVADGEPTATYQVEFQRTRTSP